MTYGRMIRDARERLGWSQDDLADRLSVSKTTISNYERQVKRPGIDMVNALVIALGLSPDAFLQALGVNLTPPSAAKLPRDLVAGLLALNAEELDVVARVVIGLPATRHQTTGGRLP